MRMALGADSSNILRMVLGQVAVMTLVGAAIGGVAAYGIGRGAASLLYDMQGRDPAVMVCIGPPARVGRLRGGLCPARRASRVDPMQSLRYE